MSYIINIMNIVLVKYLLVYTLPCAELSKRVAVFESPHRH